MEENYLTIPLPLDSEVLDGISQNCRRMIALVDSVRENRKKYPQSVCSYVEKDNEKLQKMANSLESLLV